MEEGMVLQTLCAQWEPRVGPTPRHVKGHSFGTNGHMHFILVYLVKATLKK